MTLLLQPDEKPVQTLRALSRRRRKLLRKFSAVGCIDHPSFQNWEEVKPVEIPSIPRFDILSRIDDWDAVVVPTKTRVLTTEEERYLFLYYNHLRYQFKQLNFTRLTRQLRLRAEAALEEIRKAEDILVNANLPLIFTIGKKFLQQNLTLEDLCEEGQPCILRSVRSFDVGRGFKFSTYVCNAMMKQYSRCVKQRAVHNVRNIQFDPEMSHPPAKGEKIPDQLVNKESVRLLRLILDDNLAGLTPTQMLVIRKRHLKHLDDRWTLEALGDKVGVTKERIRQIEEQAMGKLKATCLLMMNERE